MTGERNRAPRRAGSSAGTAAASSHAIPGRAPKPAQLLALRLATEQRGIFLDQLARLFHLKIEQTIEFAFEMRRREWIGTEQLTPDTLPCVWPRRPGIRYVNGNRFPRPRKDDVPYLWALNEARIHFVRSRASGRWICHADLLRDFRATHSDCVPAAVVEYPDNAGVLRRRAIELGWHRGRGAWDPDVEVDLIRETLDTLAKRYDEVEVFCGGELCAFVEREALAEEYDSFVHRKLVPPNKPPAIDHPFLVALKSQAKIGGAVEGPKPLQAPPGKRSLSIRKPCVVHRISRSGLPVEGREAIRETIARSKLPLLRRVFCTPSRTQIYCAETNIGEFRIIKSGDGWRADEVLEDWVFIKKPARDPILRAPVKPFRVYPVDIEQMPEELREALEEAKVIDQVSQIAAVWHKWSGQRDAYCVETSENLYLVVKVPRCGWVAEVIDHKLMLVQEGEPDSMDFPNVVEPPRFEIEDKLWGKIAPLLPEPSQESKRKIRYSNRAVLSGVLYRLRKGVAWRAIPAELGFGGGRGIRRQLLAWHEEGYWRAVQKLLEEELEDGQRLNWDELKLP